MGCLTSKLDDEEAIRLCKDRKNFVKQAIHYRKRFVSTHLAYIESIRRLSAALIHFVVDDYHHIQFLDSFVNPPLRSVKGKKSSSPAKNGLKKLTARIVMNYLKPGGNPSITVEEELEQEETVRIDSYYPMDYNGFSSFIVPPFSSSEYTTTQGGLLRNNTENIENGDDVVALRKIREAEGIPELEEDVDYEDNRENPMLWKVENNSEKPKADTKDTGVQVSEETSFATKQDSEEKPSVKELSSHGSENIESSEAAVEETPTFTVYMNHTPASVVEVMKEMEKQFVGIVDCAYEALAMLEENRDHHHPSSKDIEERMPNPFNSSGSKEDEGKCKRYCLEESCTISANHQSTLGRLYEWEKKLYEEVKTGECVRIAYEKKCMQFRDHDINGEDPYEVEKTRAAIKGLHTQLIVYLKKVESICKRIEVLRDVELCPQLIELICGLGQMWKTMASCHRNQKLTIEEAKLLFSGQIAATPPKSPLVAARLATELRNWQRCLADWIHAQRSYSGALSGWVSRCAPAMTKDVGEIGDLKSPYPCLNPGVAGEREVPPVCGVCLRWSQLLDSLTEARAVEGMEFFAASMASLSASQREAAGRTIPPAAAAGSVPDVRQKVLWTGMSAAMGSLTEFAVGAAEGYRLLVRKCRRSGIHHGSK